MKYYVLTTSKFAKECIEFKKYGSTNSNWLSNIDKSDIVFISQFNYHEQSIFGPFKVNQLLFYDKKIIFPGKKYYYRISLESENVYTIDETDLYIHGQHSKNNDFTFRLICLLQQNKHLHSICLNDFEGKFIMAVLKKYGKKVDSIETQRYILEYDKFKVDVNFIANKNKLYRNLFFSSESDLETYIIFCLKIKQNLTYKSLNVILNTYAKNEIHHSRIYNQFIFGNAYPSDVVIINESNINILELKKTCLDKKMLPSIKKEITKYCSYALHSNRVETNPAQINFFLLILKGKNNINFKKYLNNYFQKTTSKISNSQKYTFSIVEYYIENQNLLFLKLKRP